MLDAHRQLPGSRCPGSSGRLCVGDWPCWLGQGQRDASLPHSPPKNNPPPSHTYPAHKACPRDARGRVLLPKPPRRGIPRVPPLQRHLGDTRDNVGVCPYPAPPPLFRSISAVGVAEAILQKRKKWKGKKNPGQFFKPSVKAPAELSSRSSSSSALSHAPPRSPPRRSRALAPRSGAPGLEAPRKLEALFKAISPAVPASLPSNQKRLRSRLPSSARVAASSSIFELLKLTFLLKRERERESDFY